MKILRVCIVAVLWTAVCFIIASVAVGFFVAPAKSANRPVTIIQQTFNTETQTAHTVAMDEVVCLADNIYHEARNQSPTGQLAVGLVTLNRVKDQRFPDTICGVVKQGVHKRSWKDPSVKVPVRHKCQFSWYCDGRPDTIYNHDVYSRITKLAIALINGSVYDFTNGATHYHAEYVRDKHGRKITLKPDWSQTQAKQRIAQIEEHIFYKWK